jgi:hypothetical protein
MQYPASGTVHSKATAADKGGMCAASPFLWQFCGRTVVPCEAKRCRLEKVPKSRSGETFSTSTVNEFTVYYL